ncbi:KLRG1 protein, partial [Regulus satrapa]|nr:KLRG1 protein [Regulus satrapa]
AGDCHPPCPQECVAYRVSCYSFSTEKNWNSSQESCRAQGAHLLVISDTWEMDLFKCIQAECFWIGLRNSTSSGWIWGDGSIFNNAKRVSFYFNNNSAYSDCPVFRNTQSSSSRCQELSSWV